MTADIQRRNIYIATFLLSLVFSALAVSIDPVINNDGIWYLSVARVFAAGEWKLAVQSDVAYQWPFYSFLVGQLSAVSGMGIEWSAWVLNAVFTATTVTAFVAICRELGADNKTLFFAAIVFLLLPALNNYRSFIIRDLGYLACYSLGLLYFFRYLRTRSNIHAIAWGLFMSAGFLFRTEALVFLVLAPLVLLVLSGYSPAERFWLYLKSNIVLFAFSAIGFLVLFYLSQAYPEKEITGLVSRHINRGLSAFLNGGQILAGYGESLRSGVLAYYSKGFAMMMALLLLGFIFIFKVIHAITLPYALLWWYGKRQRVSFFGKNEHRVWSVFILINVLLLSVFLYTAAFLVTRYIMALTLTLLLCVPFLAAWFHRQWQLGAVNTRKQRILVYAILVLAVFLALDGFISTGPTKTYLKEAGLWLEGTMQPGDRLFSSNAQVRFYAKRINLLDYKDAPKEASQMIRQTPWQEVVQGLDSAAYKDYDYVALTVNRHKKEQLPYAVSKMGAEPIKVFVNNRGDKLAIFKVAKTVQ